MSTALGLLSLIIAFAVVAAVAARNRYLAAPLLTAFALRAGLALLDALVYLLPGQDDSLGFDYFGWYQARNGFFATFSHLETGANLYTWLVSACYALFDRSRLMMQGLNVLFGTLVVLNVARLTESIGQDARLGRRAAWLTAVFPSAIYFSAVMLREVAVTYPLSLGVLYLARWYRERENWQLVAGAAASLVSMAFHSGAVGVLVVLGALLTMSWLRSASSRGFRHLGRNTLALAAGVAVLVFVYSSNFGLDKFQHVRSGNVDDLSQAQRNFAHGRTAYLEDFHAESQIDVTWQAPVRLAYFLFAPFPWMVRAAPDIVGLVDSTFISWLFFRLWRERRTLRQRPDALLVLAVFAAMAVIFAVGVSNYGTAHRHRNKMLPLLVAVACALPTARKQRGLVPALASAGADRFA